MLWELSRIAVHCDVDTNHLRFSYDESWKDQDAFWTSIKSFRGFQGKRFPAKSDPRAWRAGIDDCFDGDSQAVVFTATLHITDAATGSPIRLELEPFKCEQSCRLFRRFGSHRFLELRVPSLESWQADEGDVEEVVAQWLTSGRHEFMTRLWSAFYVRDRSMKTQLGEGPQGQEPKVVFYDRVLFFAEAGISPSAARSVGPVLSRTEMLDWLLALQDQDAQSYLKLFHRVALGMRPPLLLY